MAALNGNRAVKQTLELDACIVGAGFGGVYQLKRLRDEGFNVKLVENGSDFGGVWHDNQYPGARVEMLNDSLTNVPTPHYEFSSPELWTDWQWTQRFPGSAELRAYFKYVADKWNLRKDTIFNSHVNSAVWNDATQKWTIITENGYEFRARFFLPNTGVAAKQYVPDFQGLEKFKGTFVHSTDWSKRDVPLLEGKRIAVIGTGASGVQLTQDLAPIASDFTLFQRTPTTATPMRQEEHSSKERVMSKDDQAALYEGRLRSFPGLDFNFIPVRTFDHSPEERMVTYQRLWDEGDFHYCFGSYADVLFDDEANTEAYNFWRDKTRARIRDPRMKEKLAPMTKSYALGTKRPPLENGFYDLFDDPKLHVVNINDTPFVEFIQDGIRTTETEHQFDYIVSATRFDAVTGGLPQMGITGRNGVSLSEKWKGGLKTYFGLAVSGFPNMFFTYGPQAPTSLCNGPTCAEVQGEWIVAALKHMRDKDLKVIDAAVENEKQWAEGVSKLANMSLLPKTKSWYMGDKIPGKNRECLFYLEGVPTYYKLITESATNGYEGFNLH